MKRKFGFRICIYVLLVATCSVGPAFASIFGTVRGIVHDAQHRPISGAHLQLQAKQSDWKREAFSDDQGKFQFDAVPAGDYSIHISRDAFREYSGDLAVTADSAPLRHFPLELAGVSEKVEVSENAQTLDTSSSVSQTTLSRETISSTPGATRTNSLDLITDYTPGAYMVHDQLHVRGGHQVSWLVDGIPVPNTNIASNVGPQFDPKDMDVVEIQRGGYAADYGDRTYGVFNVVPRTGFERNRQAELVLSAGNFWQTNDQFSLGSHSERFAYYASVNDNRSNLGIQTPVPQVVHDAANGYGGFGSLIFNIDPSNQLRLVTSLREDYYQIPYDPFPNDIEFFLGTYFQLTNADDGFAVLSLQPSELRQWGRRPYRCNPASCVDLWRGAGQLQREFSEERFSGGRIQLLPAQQRGSGSDVSGRKRERAVHGRGASLR